MAAVACCGVGAPCTASAQDRAGYQQIASGDYRSAEQALTAERRISPDRPAFVLNLAAVYTRTERASDARALYGAVLRRPNGLMDVAVDRTAWSHDLTHIGLSRIDGIRLSSR